MSTEAIRQGLCNRAAAPAPRRDRAVVPDGSGVLVLGNYRDGNIFLAKFGTTGGLLWDITWGRSSEAQESAGALAVASNGTIYIAGRTSSFDA